MINRAKNIVLIGSLGCLWQGPRGQTSPFSVQTVDGYYNCCTTVHNCDNCRDPYSDDEKSSSYYLRNQISLRSVYLGGFWWLATYSIILSEAMNYRNLYLAIISGIRFPVGPCAWEGSGDWLLIQL